MGGESRNNKTLNLLRPFTLAFKPLHWIHRYLPHLGFLSGGTSLLDRQVTRITTVRKVRVIIVPEFLV